MIAPAIAITTTEGMKYTQTGVGSLGCVTFVTTVTYCGCLKFVPSHATVVPSSAIVVTSICNRSRCEGIPATLNTALLPGAIPGPESSIGLVSCVTFHPEGGVTLDILNCAGILTFNPVMAVLLSEFTVKSSELVLLTAIVFGYT